MTAKLDDYLDKYSREDDFDSKPFWKPATEDHGYLKGMWGKFRSMNNPLAEDTVLAHGMVQSFVNAFARDGRYVVVFDPDTNTAGTDMEDRFVSITPSPIADKDLTAEEAGLILTGLAVHEISHPRYGRMTYQAVESQFYGNRVAARLSNLLDDIRIEQRFIEDYPGYAGIFKPTLDYVGGRGLKGKKLRTQSLKAPVNLAIAATRYPEFNDWSDPALAKERDWWQAWADRWAPEDSPVRHVEGIREALAHIVDLKDSLSQPSPSSESGEGSGGEKDGDGDKQQAGAEADMDGSGSSSGEGDGEPTDDEPEKPGRGGSMTDGELNRETKDADKDEANRESSCSGSGAVDLAAKEGDTNDYEITRLKEEAQQIIENARNQEDDGYGNKIDVAKSLRGIGGSSSGMIGSESVSRQIKNAIIQSRSGHMEVEPFRRSGRLDQKGLARIAHGDYRTFEKRTAPSVGEYLIWIMCDWSISMSGSVTEVTRVAHSIAAASVSLPSVRMAVWAWSEDFRPTGADASVAKAWETGQPLKNIFQMRGLNMGGTPDSYIMGWAHHAILREARRDEQPVIIFISDGEGLSDMDEKVNAAREAGIIVVSVSFGRGFTPSAQEARFGPGNYIPFQGSIEATGKPLAKMITRIVTKGAKR